MLKLHQVSTNQTQAGKRQTGIDGRQYLVLPSIPIKASVLGGAYVPADEIAAYVEAWNGIPFTLNHPDNNGKPISANSPEIIAKQSIGRVWNSRFDESDNTLHSEIWIDIDKAKSLSNDSRRALAMLEANRQMEVSTGYFADHETTGGDFEGQPYKEIARNIRPDHLALLLDGVGNCSIADGCGIPRINEAEDEELDEGFFQKVTKIIKEIIMNEPTGKVTTNDDVVDEVKDAATVPAIESPTVPNWGEMFGDLSTKVAALTKTVEGIVTDAADAADAAKVEIIKELIANARVVLTADELEGFDLLTLNKLRNSLIEPDYSGQGGVVSNESDEYEYGDFTTAKKEAK